MYCSTHSRYIPPPHIRNSIQESSSGARLECNIVISKTQFILPFYTTQKSIELELLFYMLLLCLSKECENSQENSQDFLDLIE